MNADSRYPGLTAPVLSAASAVVALVFLALYFVPSYHRDGSPILLEDSFDRDILADDGGKSGGVVPWRIKGETIESNRGTESGNGGVVRLRATAGKKKPRLVFVRSWDLSASHISAEARLRADRLRRDGKSWQRGLFIVRFLDGKNKTIKKASFTVASLEGTKGWKLYKDVVRVPEGTAGIKVILQNSGRSGDLLVDEVRIAPVAPSPFFEGLRYTAFFVLIATGAAVVRRMGVRLRAIPLGGALVALAIVVATLLPGPLVRRIDEGLSACSARIHAAVSGPAGNRETRKKGGDKQDSLCTTVPAQKLGHAMLFFVLSFAVIRAAAKRRADGDRPASFKDYLPVLYALLIFASATEILQLAVIERSASPRDFLIDALGIATGAVAGAVRQRRGETAGRRET